MPVGETFRDETEHLEALHAGAAQADGSGDRIEEAAVELVEFGDYECPHCRMAHPIVKRLSSGSTTGSISGFATPRCRRFIHTRSMRPRPR
jgi:hypothetical protein